MPDYRVDQADGLRRLFRREQPQIVSFASGSAGVGKSLLVANLAFVLARQGKEVLIVDENTRNNVASFYGVRTRHDLMKVLDGDVALNDALLPLVPGVRLLPAASAVKRLAMLTDEQRETFLASLSGMERPADVILVDTSREHPLGFSPFGLAAHDTVMVMSASGDSITDTYALIKKVSLGYARRHFRILVTKVRGEDEAMAIFGNIAHVTKSRRIARLDYAGFVPQEEGPLRQALRHAQPVCGLFPEAPLSRAYRTIASGLLAWPVPEAGSGGVEQFLQTLLHLSQHIDPVPIYA